MNNSSILDEAQLSRPLVSHQGLYDGGQVTQVSASGQFAPMQSRTIKPFTLDGLGSQTSFQNSLFDSRVGATGKAQVPAAIPDGVGNRLSESSSHTSMESQELDGEFGHRDKTFGRLALQKT